MKVVTVTGDVDPETLGITMTHEHPLINMTSWFRMPTEESKKWIAKSMMVPIVGSVFIYAISIKLVYNVIRI